MGGIEAVDIALPHEARSAGRARQVLEPFRDLLSETRFGDLRLLVSELVAEAVGGFGGARGGTIKLHAKRDGDRVRARVQEGADVYVLPSAAPEPGEVGWSIYLVQRLSDAWGVRRDKDSATVWLEMALSGPDPAPTRP